jgi:chemotaxis signal transduction protein
VSDDSPVLERIDALRRAFDESFACPRSEQGAASLDFLTFSFGERRFALPVSELAVLEKRRKIVPLPNAARACLGVSGVRGKLVAVYDLSALLSLPPAADLRWLLVPSAERGVAFAISELEGYRRAPAEAVFAREVAADDPCVAGLIHGDLSCSVLSAARLLGRLGGEP